MLDDLVNAIADAVATRVSASRNVPTSLLQQLRSGDRLVVSLDPLGVEAHHGLQLVLKTYENQLYLEFSWHGGIVLYEVLLLAPPALGSAT